VRFFRTERADEALPVVAAYVRRIEELAAAGAQVVVLPEKFVGVTPAYADAVRDAFAEAARRQRVWVVAGLNRVEGPPRRNAALVRSGALVCLADERHGDGDHRRRRRPPPTPPRAERAHEPGASGVAISSCKNSASVASESLARVAILIDHAAPPRVHQQGRADERRPRSGRADYLDDHRLGARRARPLGSPAAPLVFSS
jgi:hypothetical protein